MRLANSHHNWERQEGWTWKGWRDVVQSLSSWLELLGQQWATLWTWAAASSLWLELQWCVGICSGGSADSMWALGSMVSVLKGLWEGSGQAKAASHRGPSLGPVAAAASAQWTASCTTDPSLCGKGQEIQVLGQYSASLSTDKAEHVFTEKEKDSKEFYGLSHKVLNRWFLKRWYIDNWPET